MAAFTRTIDGVTYLDETRLWESVSTKDTPVPTRLSRFMRLAGVRFFDEEEGGYQFVQQPLVAITGFGGFPVTFDDSTPPGHVVLNKSTVTPAAIVDEFRNTMGRAGCYSYMNTGNHTAAVMDGITTRHGHFSKTHTVVVDMAVLGYSAAIEGNLMLLRRWFNHVGRLTNTRCLAQAEPPLVVLEPEDLSLARSVRNAVKELLNNRSKPEQGQLSSAQYREKLADYYERVNALWPNSRALILMVNADLSNLRGTMGDIADPGQELESRRILAQINDLLFGLFPEALKHSSAYGWDMPSHWPARAAWEAVRNGLKK